MRSIQLVAPRRLEMAEVPTPEPAAGEILVQIRAVGLCGSDMHWYLEGCIGHGKCVYPMVLGHEPVGEVAEVGKGVRRIRKGDRVSLEPSVTCGHCEWCARGQHNLCSTAIFMGGPQREGFLRDYVTIPAHNADLIPEGMSWREATLMEPVAVMVHIAELVKVKFGDTVAVMGTGPIGVLAIQMAKAAGAAKIFACDRIPHRVEMGKAAGASVTVNSGNESFYQAVMDETGGRGVDVVYDAAGSPETINLGISVCRSGGNYVLIGIPSQHNFAIDVHTAMNKELRLQMIKRSNHKGKAAGELLRAGLISRDVITHALPLEKATEGFEMLAHYEDNVGKLVFDLTL